MCICLHKSFFAGELGHQIISDDLNDLQNGTEICNFSPFCKSFSKNFSNFDPLPPQSGMSTHRTLLKVGCFVHISQGRFAAPVRPCMELRSFSDLTLQRHLTLIHGPRKCNQFISRPNYTLSYKKTLNSCPYLHQILTDFQHSFTATFSYDSVPACDRRTDRPMDRQSDRS